MLLIANSATEDFDKEFFEVIPAVAEVNAWIRLRRLRECLQKQGRLLEARAILDQEYAFTPDGSEQEKACKSLLEACLNQKDSQQPIWWIIGRTKLRLCQTLIAGSQVQASDDAFEDARRALQAAHASGIENNTLLQVRLVELNALKRFEHPGALQAYDEFVQCASVKKDNYIHSTALSQACDVALLPLESKKTPSNLKTFWQWYRRAESTSEELGDIAYLPMLRMATGDIACRVEGNFGAILKWHDDFEMKYPFFHFWRHKKLLRRSRLTIYKGLKDSENIVRTIAEMQYIEADQDDFWSEDGFRKQADIRGSSEDRKPDITTPAAFKEGDFEMDWLLEWSEKMYDFINAEWTKATIQNQPDSIRASALLEIHLCSWIKSEFDGGILTEQNLADILGSDPVGDSKMPKEHVSDAIKSEAGSLESSSNHSLKDIVSALTPETLSSRLFGTHNAPSSGRRWEKAYSTLSDWLLRKSTRREARRHFLLYQVQNKRLSDVIIAASSNELCALEAQRLIDLLPKLDVKVQEHVSTNLGYWRSTVAASKHRDLLIAHRSDILLDMHSPEIKEIVQLYNQSLEDIHDGKDLLMQEIQINMGMARVYNLAALRLDPIPTEGLLNAAARAVQAYEKVRAGWRALTGWNRVEKLLLALEQPSILQIAPTVVTVVRNVPDDKRDGRDRQIWDTIQFAKSIGISWLIDANAADAQEKATEGNIEGDHIHIEAVALEGEPKKASDSKGDLSTQPNTGQASNEDSTTSKGQENKKTTAAKAEGYVEDETKGGFDTQQLLADLQNINQLGGDAIFVDWYNDTCELTGMPRPIVATLSGTNEGPRCFRANIIWEQVEKVVNEFMGLETEDLKDDGYTEVLYELNPLVEVLAWTKPGQTLVFSPCGNLHRIPLHALKIDGEVIIKRNPVVYCSSLSALASTYRLRVSMDPQNSTLSTANVANAENPALYPRADPAPKVLLYGDQPTSNGRAALEATATKFRAKAHTGESFTASSFTSSIQDPGLHLLHYHGHADFSPTDPTAHCLLFSDRDRLTLKDVFDLPSPLSHGGGFHVTLLGCGSGMSKTGPTDDVIGLVPSLLYAGASSTVSTLWKFSDMDAAAYSESFYAGFVRGGADAGENMVEAIPSSAGDVVVDLAKANQMAVLHIMQSRPALYHWAPFVLNGYWMMRSPLVK